MTDLHKHYNKLAAHECEFVDDVFADIFRAAKLEGIPLNGTDPAERAVDALARLVIESRPKPPPSRFAPPRRIARPTMTAAEKELALENERNSFDKWAAEVRP